MMHMTLYWGRKVTILFRWWTTESMASYSLTLLVCFLVCVLYQFVEYQKAQFRNLASASAVSSPSSPSPESPLFVKLSGARRFSWPRLAAAVLFGGNLTLAYLVMLAVMSFNGGVLVAVVLGMSVGFYVFRSVEDGAGGEVLVADADNDCACS